MRLRSLVSLVLSFSSFLATSLAKPSTGSSVLIILEPKLQKEEFSQFFNGLEGRGYDLTFRAPKDVTPEVAKYDVPNYSHVIFFAPTTKSFAQDLNVQAIVSLLSSNPSSNLLIALGPTTTPLSTLASEFSISVPPPDTPLISHFPPRSSPHTIVTIPLPNDAHPLLTRGTPPLLFSGIPFLLGDSPFLVPILNAPAESFATDTVNDKDADAVVESAEKGGEGLWAGSRMGVVTGFVARSGARVTWVGGVSIFSDEFANAEIEPGRKTGNAQFSRDIAAWTFQETLVFRVDNSTHYLASDPSQTPRDKYTTGDTVVFTTYISAFDGASGTWKRTSKLKDVQLEFTMLDPHIRTSLLPAAGEAGKYSVKFQVPDRHGVFKFIVDYKRKGYTPLHVSLPVSIVPPRHDGYPRFLVTAWPYYAGAISTSLGFIVFCFIWLSGEAERRAKGKEKTE